MDPQKNLIRIEGVKAELYLQSGNRILRMIETKEMIEPDLQEIAVIANNNSFKNSVRTLDKEEVKEDFFYTLVNNYSHYAYNLTDFVDEKNYGAGGNSEEEKYWLYRIFHKNDGYQSPISLHPYRKWGNIDINREKDLSDQRLLSLIMSSSSSLGDGLLMDFNGKQPFMIELTLLESTKLKEKTIKERFEWYKNTNWLGDTADEIRRISTKSNEKEIFKFLKLEIINQFLALVDSIDKNEIDKERGLVYINARVLDYVKEINGKDISGQYPFSKVFEFYTDLNDKKKFAAVMSKLFKPKKNIRQVTFNGLFVEGGATVTTTYEDVPDDVKELVDIGVYTEEEAIAACSTGGSRERHMVLTKPYIKNTDGTSIPQIFDDVYTEDDLSFNVDTDDTEEVSSEEFDEFLADL
jgi:hypothetical protein